MVKIGFIVEGATEKIILESSDFINYLKSLSIDYIPDIIDAEGNGNLLPQNIIPYSKILEEKGANKIFILTDLDKDECITKTKIRISPLPDHILAISVKEIEAWFLSDTEAIRKFLNDTTFEYPLPELIDEPFETIKRLKIEKTGRGIVNKTTLARQMLRCDFSIQRASRHPQCDSAKYFLKKIFEISKNN